jgi:hypothetical protein
MKYTLEEQLHDHLLYGIFPSQLTSLVKTCVKAIELANEGKYEEFLPFNIMVDGKSGEQIKDSTGYIDAPLVCDVSGAYIELIWEGTYWRLFS